MNAEPTAGPSAPSMASAPAWVRDGSPALQHDYALGVEFETLLSQEMASAMTATAGLGESSGGEEEGGGSQPGGGVLSTMLSGALAQGVSDGGGLGVAAEIAREMQSQTGTAPKAADAAPIGGGTSAQTTGGTSS